MHHTSGNTIPLVSDQLLEDYADGRLDPQTERRVEGVIANDRDLRDKVLSMIAVREAIRSDVGSRAGTPRDPLTWELGDAVERQLRRPKRGGLTRIVPFGAVAASAVVLTIAGMNGDFFVTKPADLQQAAVQTLLQSGVPAQVAQTKEVEPGGEVVPVTSVPDRSAQTSSAEAMPEIVPDFSKFGFDLVETRLVAGNPDDAVHLLYEGKNGRRLSLYYSGTKGEDKQQVSVRQEGPLALLFWHAEGRSFSMIGEVQRNELLDMARTVTKGISVDQSADNGPQDGTNPAVEPSLDQEGGIKARSDA
ncbi:anti-sigma factor family protein [Pacificispira sp.]|uniref:anti-sigma factor family protein n=1 Tax=Pacificispira sp. TaxID=2888761 RepID=UPI003BA9ED6C